MHSNYCVADPWYVPETMSSKVAGFDVTYQGYIPSLCYLLMNTRPRGTRAFTAVDLLASGKDELRQGPNNLI